VVRFLENSFSFNQLTISRADIPCILENDVAEAARSTQPVTLYITVKVMPPTLYNSPPSIPTADDGSLAEEAPIPGRILFPTPEHPLRLSHDQPIETGNNKPQSGEEEASPSTGAMNPRLALDGADETMKPIAQSNTWEGAVGRIKWVMDTLSPFAEVRIIPLFMFMSLAELTSTFSFSHSQRWRTVYC
jgi:hypothetical protein